MRAVTLSACRSALTSGAVPLGAVLLGAVLAGGCATTPGPAPGTADGRSPAATLAAAQEAEAAGQPLRALDLYLAVAHAPAASAASQAEALWRAALLRLGPGEARDVADGQKLIAGLLASPPAAERREVAAVDALLADLAGARAEAERLNGELEASKVAGRDASDAELKRLRSELASTKTALAEAREEIARKEEALRKIKETLVGRKDG